MKSDLDLYQEAAMTTRASAAADFTYAALGLNGEAGEVAEHAKKAIRDDGGMVTSARRENIAKELGDVLWYLAACASDCNLSLAQIARGNLKKLRDRQERGVITGDGDHR